MTHKVYSYFSKSVRLIASFLENCVRVNQRVREKLLNSGLLIGQIALLEIWGPLQDEKVCSIKNGETTSFIMKVLDMGQYNQQVVSYASIINGDQRHQEHYCCILCCGWVKVLLNVTDPVACFNSSEKVRLCES